MNKNLNENTSFNISIKTLIAIGVGIATLIGFYYSLQTEIDEAKELPKNEISRTEYDLKDQLVRETILKTQEDVTDIKDQLKRIEDKIYQ